MAAQFLDIVKVLLPYLGNPLKALVPPISNWDSEKCTFDNFFSYKTKKVYILKQALYVKKFCSADTEQNSGCDLKRVTTLMSILQKSEFFTSECETSQFAGIEMEQKDLFPGKVFQK